MGPKKKGKGKGKDAKEEVKEEIKKPVEEEPMPDYDWLPKKRKPKEEEGPTKPVDDGLWLWPGDNKGKPIRSETFWSSGQPPQTPPENPRKPLKETDKGWCFLKDGPFIKSRPPSVCVEHGVVADLEVLTSLEKQAKTVWCHENCSKLEQDTVAQCTQHGHVHHPIFVKAEVVETIDKWDIQKTYMVIPCGDGSQLLRWLGHAACTRMAFIKNEAPTKFLPLAIKSEDGYVLDSNQPIKEVLQDGSHIIVNYSSGPRTYREPWDGRPPSPTADECIKDYIESTIGNSPIVVDTPPPKPPPPKVKKKKKGEVEAPPPLLVDPENPDAPPQPPPPQFFEVEVQTPIDIVTFLDWQAYDIPDLLLKIKGDLDEELFNVEWIVVQEMLRAFSGGIEAILLWFGGQGIELEDQDFCYLNSDQIVKLFSGLRLSPAPFTVNKLREYFLKYATVNMERGGYQLTSWGFFPILLHLFHFSGLYEKFGIYYQADPPVPFHEKIWHFFTAIVLPNFAIVVKSRLEDLHSAEIPEAVAIMKEHEETCLAALRIVNPEYVQPSEEGQSVIDLNDPAPGLPDLSSPESKAAALEVAIVKQEEKEEAMKTKDDRDAPIVFANVWTQVDMEVDVKVIMPHFKKWLVLGDVWDDVLAAGITIYALQKSVDVLDFTMTQSRLRFGVEEIQRFLLAASHCLYNMQRKPLLRVSEHSFLRTYLQAVFVRAKVAKPLYTTYQEKLAYMRLQCFRQEEPLPPMPEKKKGFN
ncbi:unnamed protein product [Calypogeia fissa]